jgi:hypothetical protein
LSSLKAEFSDLDPRFSIMDHQGVRTALAGSSKLKTSKAPGEYSFTSIQ